jgi:DNA-binding beta-propeller fold protein YncE
MLRVPRDGGIPHVAPFPYIDSTAWTGTDALPAIDRVLAFDAEDGLIAAVDARGLPLWLDLRVGTVTKTGREKPRAVVSVDGSTIYGVGSDGVVARFTPPGNWTYKPGQAAVAAYPQISGTLVVLTGRGRTSRIIRIRPPASKVLDSLDLPDATPGTAAPLGDRVFFVQNGRSLTAVQARSLAKGNAISLDHHPIDLAATPSGDRIYVATDSSSTMSVVDAIQERVSATIDLPGRARELRVDPIGRYVLVRPAHGDSVWVVSVGSDKVVGTMRTKWEGDVPFVAPDGSIATSDGRDIIFVEVGTNRELRRAIDGASDFWYSFVWNGFRSRSSALDAPARFSTDSDTTSKAPPPIAPVAPRTDTAKPRPIAPPPPARDTTTARGFTVSFAVLLDGPKARDLAAKIMVDGKNARVVPGSNDGIPVYRVVLGPYATRDEAERVGKASGHAYYVYAGAP